MSQPVLIIAISLMTAVIVGSVVFFVWTYLEKLFSRPASTETAGESNNEEEQQSESADEQNQQA